MLQVDEPVNVSEVDWDRAVDVVVVGLGVAGACAALEAHRYGAGVLVLERASVGGGASAASEGIFYLGGQTALQRDLGYEDSPENMYRFLRASTTTPDDVALREFCDGSVEHFDWLEAQGLQFERAAYTKKAVAVRTGEGLLTTGNEKLPQYAQVAKPVPRGHQARGGGDIGGGALATRALISSVERADIPITYDTGVKGLVVDDDRAVLGVQVRTSDNVRRSISARKGVVIATGSFNLNAALCAQHIPVVAAHGRALGVDSNDGSGLLMAETVGAACRGMEGVIATSSIYPPEELVFGIIINSLGERFVAEGSYHGRTAYHVERQPGQAAWLLVDEPHFAYPERGHALVDVFDTPGALEAALGMPGGSVARTLDSYNAGVAQGRDECGKDPSWMATLAFPLAVFDLSFRSSEYSYISLGGLDADQSGRVKDAAGQPIPGLYAAGAVAAHIPQSGQEYASGLSLGPGSFFARRAGRHAASRS